MLASQKIELPNACPQQTDVTNVQQYTASPEFVYTPIALAQANWA